VLDVDGFRVQDSGIGVYSFGFRVQNKNIGLMV
jgi:hypothetical protein